MDIKTLRMTMMKLKKTEPQKAKVYSALLSLSLIIAKNDGNREVKDEDIVLAAKKELKMAQQSKDSGAPYIEETFEICKSFLPKVLTKEDTKKIIEEIIKKLDNPNMGLIMKELKSQSGVDMKIASQLVKELI